MVEKFEKCYLPPVRVNVAKTYSASVLSASFLAVMNKLYHVPGLRSVIVMFCCSGIILLLTKVHSCCPCALYCTTKKEMGQPPLCQEFKFTRTLVEFTVKSRCLSGVMGAETIKSCKWLYSFYENKN